MAFKYEMQGYEVVPEDQEDVICVRNDQGELVEVEVEDDADDD